MMNNKRYIKAFVLVSCLLVFFILHSDIGSKAGEFDTSRDEKIENRYMFVSSANCTLSISSSGTATVTAKVKGNTGTVYIGATVYLEKNNGGTWQSYSSWTHSGYSELNSSDTTTVTHGTYRVRMTVTVYNLGLSEEFDVTGNTVVY